MEARGLHFQHLKIQRSNGFDFFLYLVLAAFFFVVVASKHHLGGLHHLLNQLVLLISQFYGKHFQELWKTLYHCPLTFLMKVWMEALMKVLREFVKVI